MTYTYRAVEGGKGIKIWGGPMEDGALAQADDLARLPFVIDHVALMPDAHQGYGMPIGGVLFADKAVVPYAIGVDIGCGVILAQTDLRAGDLVREALPKVAQQVLRDVPVGNGPGGNLTARLNEDFALNLMGYAEMPHMVSWGAWNGALGQLGTLGGGNHFIEFQADEDNRVYVMIHSGSRSLGKKTCDDFVAQALELNDLWHSRLPNRELAFLPTETPQFDNYWDAMAFAMRFAEVNRDQMLNKVQLAFNRHAPTTLTTIVDCHHNYANWENHLGKNGIVHRKGAVQARLGQDVLIPGSMGTASYWAKGLGNKDSFETCQHGAGRAMARGVARRTITLENMEASLAKAQTTVYTHSLDAVRDEAPGAYKNVEDVMAASSDLVEVVKKLRPLGTVKG